MDNSALLLLGQTYRAEIMATRAVNEIMDHCNQQKTKAYLDRLVTIHIANQHQIREICKTLRFSPGDEVELPEKIEKLLVKKNVPERVLLTWLNQCETQLSELYRQIEGISLPDGVMDEMVAARQRQQSMMDELITLRLDSTEVLDPSPWEN